jgi:hypothetical protein
VHDRSALGPADVDDARLAALVAAALDVPEIELLWSRAEVSSPPGGTEPGSPGPHTCSAGSPRVRGWRSRSPGSGPQRRGSSSIS